MFIQCLQKQMKLVIFHHIIVVYLSIKKDSRIMLEVMSCLRNTDTNCFLELSRIFSVRLDHVSDWLV